MKPRVREVIVVEGRYDKNTLLQAVDAAVIETGGFAVFNDREKTAYLRRLAQTRGLILLTDPDGAGFVIRDYLKGVLPPDRLKQAYVPDVYGRERRKKKGGKEGKLGVEGMSPAVLLEALRRADPLYLEPSFDPILATGAHSAIVHYSPTPESDAPIQPNAFLLADTGGHYYTGTTVR